MAFASHTAAISKYRVSLLCLEVSAEVQITTLLVTELDQYSLARDACPILVRTEHAQDFQTEVLIFHADAGYRGNGGQLAGMGPSNFGPGDYPETGDLPRDMNPVAQEAFE